MRLRKERREMQQVKDREEARKSAAQRQNNYGEQRGREDRQSRVRVLPPDFDEGLS